MIGKIIDFLEKKQHESAIRYKEKRQRKIKKLMLDLYRESALFKVPVSDLNYMKDMDSKKDIKYRWFVDYTDEFIN